MTRKIMALIGLALLAGCSGGGGDSATSTSAPAPTAQPDMLVATSDGLLRGKASGQGQHLIFAHTNLQRETVMVSDPNVVYSRTATSGSDDVWAVRTDGTGDHLVLNGTQNHFSFLRAVSGPWLIYSKDIGDSQEHWSLRLDTLAQFFLADPAAIGTDIQFHGTNRALMGTDYEMFSVSLTGTDRLTYASVLGTRGIVLSNMLIVGDALVYRRTNVSELPLVPPSNIFVVPLAGGTPVLLENDQFYAYSVGSIGARVVYQRCGTSPSEFTCDVASVHTNGTNRAILASQPANEAVQGVTTDQVIIRRNLAGNDQLIAVPVTGGPETLLMNMTDSEFVDLIVGDLLVVRRPSGTWRLDLNGTLTKLGTIIGDSGFVAVGNSVCVTKVTAVWCMPLDGSGTQVKIADEGKVVGVL